MALPFIAIVLLAAAWAALLLPDLRGRGGGSSRRSNSIAKFSSQLSTLERTRPGHRPSARIVQFPQRGPVQRQVARKPASPLSPRSQAQARERRRNVLFVLVGVAGVTLLAGVLISPMLLIVHLLADVAVGGYVWMLVEHRNRTFEQRSRAELRAVPEITHLQRRRASGS